MAEHKDDRSVEVRAVAAVFMSVACVAVILRVYVRGRLVKAFGWDDTAMVIAMAFYAMFSGCMIGGSLYGTGRRFKDLTAHERVTAMKYWWLCEIAYCFASVGCKVSVCIFLLRITIRRLHNWILYVVMFLTVLAGLVFMFILLLQCKPLDYFWTRKAFDPSIHGSCMDMDVVIAMTYVYSVFAAICDFTVGILPIFIVHKLHMRRQTKIAVVGILSMACIASSAVIVRFPFVHTFNDPDFLYATVEIALWSNIETGLGITAGSLATLRPLLRYWLGSSTSHSYSASPFPKYSLSRRPNDNRGGGATRDRTYPLGSLDDSVQGRLRPDKLAVTVTTVHTQQDPEERWRVSNSSEERLTSEMQRGRERGGSGGNGEGSGGHGEAVGLGMGITRTFEVTQTRSEIQPVGVMEQV